MAKSQGTEGAFVWQLESPRFENGRPLLIAGLRGHFTTSDWDRIPAQWERLISFGEVPGHVGHTHYGLCFQMRDGVDYLSGVEVSSASGLPAEFNHVKIPAQKYAVFAHREHVSKLRDTLEAIWNRWLHASEHEVVRPSGGPDFFERYGEEFNPQTGTGGIEVWIPVKS